MREVDGFGVEGASETRACREAGVDHARLTRLRFRDLEIVSGKTLHKGMRLRSGLLFIEAF